MTRRRDLLGLQSLALFPLVAAGLLVLSPTPPPRPPLPPPASLLLGAAAGTVLFSALARRRPPLPRAAPAIASLAVAALAASEEAIWRGFVLARLAPHLGLAAAVVVSAAAFAVTHFPGMRRRGVAVHLGTGAVFGTVFATSGSLAACTGAHVAYNLLVLHGRPPARRDLPPPPERLPLVRLERVSKRFGSVTALEGFSLLVEEGEIVALLGPNGAGKTTAVGLLLGVRRPNAGTVELLGRDPRAWRTRTAVGATPQEMSFPPTLRVREILDFAAAHYPAPAPRDELLAQFGLSGLGGRRVGGLSGGERRRLAVALAFVGAPRLLVLDEPAASLDVESRRNVWEAIRGHRARGGAVLLTTHHLEEAEALADRIVLLSRGTVVAAGTAAEIKSAAGPTLEDAFLHLTGDGP